MDPTHLNAVGDQYSLGCVIYFLVSGRYPFPDGTAVEKMMAHQHKQPTPLKELAPSVPDDLAAAVERLMQKAPANRYASTRELIEALQPIAGVAAAAAPRAAARPVSMPNVSIWTDKNPAPPTFPANGGAPGRAAHETPRPGARPPAPPAPKNLPASVMIPSRQALQNSSPQVKAPSGARPAARRAATAATPAKAKKAARASQFPGFEDQKGGWEERLGPIGIAVVAVLACAAAWLLTRGLF
jgi:serine/threonine-protein kinase